MAEPIRNAQAWIPEDTFGARLALVRQHLGGWNMRRAALQCGLDPESWRKWEAGANPRDLEGVARKVAGGSGCDLSWLMLGGPLTSKYAAWDSNPEPTDSGPMLQLELVA